MSTCPETYRYTVSYYPPTHEVIPCFREVDADGRHRGTHQGWVHLPPRDPDPTSQLAHLRDGYPGGDVLLEFDRGGSKRDAAGADYDTFEPCPLCGALTPPVASLSEAVRFPGSPDAYSVPQPNLGGACFTCRLWAERIEAHAAGWQAKPRQPGRRTRTIRIARDGVPSERLNAWAEGVTGAYGGWEVTVEWLDGDRRGPASSMWDCGAIPWWLDDQFPVNARLVTEPARAGL